MKTDLRVLALLGASLGGPLLADTGANLQCPGDAVIQAYSLDGTHSNASATQPVGSFFGSIGTLAGNPDSLYGFGGIRKSWFGIVIDQGWRVDVDGAWVTDVADPSLDIPPKSGRAAFGMVPFPDGAQATRFLAIGGASNQGSTSPPAGQVPTADLYTPGIGWSTLAMLPNPSTSAVGRWCAGSGCDSTCTANAECEVHSSSIIDGAQSDGAQSSLHETVGNSRYALVAGGLTRSPNYIKSQPSLLTVHNFYAFTNNAIFYDSVDGRFYDVPMAPIAYPVPGNCQVDNDCQNGGQRCVSGFCSPSAAYVSGSDPDCVMLGNSTDQTVCCGGRTVHGGEASFPFANTCQIFTPNFSSPADSTWQLCSAWAPVPGEDDNANADQYTHGRAEIAMAVTSDKKVLMFGGKVRMATNASWGASRAIRVFDPARCGSGSEYTLSTTAMTLPRESAPLVTLTNIDASGDTYLIIGGSQGNDRSLGGSGHDNYQTERAVWDPATGAVQTQADLNLPFQIVNGVALPYTAGFASQAVLLGDGYVASYGGPIEGSADSIGSPRMITFLRPDGNACQP